MQDQTWLVDILPEPVGAGAGQGVIQQLLQLARALRTDLTRAGLACRVSGDVGESTPTGARRIILSLRVGAYPGSPSRPCVLHPFTPREASAALARQVSTQLSQATGYTWAPVLLWGALSVTRSQGTSAPTPAAVVYLGETVDGPDQDTQTIRKALTAALCAVTGIQAAMPEPDSVPHETVALANTSATQASTAAVEPDTTRAVPDTATPAAVDAPTVEPDTTRAVPDTATPAAVDAPTVESDTAQAVPGTATPAAADAPAVEPDTAQAIPGTATPAASDAPAVESDTAQTVPDTATPAATDAPAVEPDTTQAVPDIEPAVHSEHRARSRGPAAVRPEEATDPVAGRVSGSQVQPCGVTAAEKRVRSSGSTPASRPVRARNANRGTSRMLTPEDAAPIRPRDGDQSTADSGGQPDSGSDGSG